MPAHGGKNFLHMNVLSIITAWTGKNAGMPVIGAEWGFRGRKELEERGADFLLQSPSQLPQLVAQLMKEQA